MYFPRRMPGHHYGTHLPGVQYVYIMVFVYAQRSGSLYPTHTRSAIYTRIYILNQKSYPVCTTNVGMGDPLQISESERTTSTGWRGRRQMVFVCTVSSCDVHPNRFQITWHVRVCTPSGIAVLHIIIPSVTTDFACVPSRTWRVM